MMAALYYAPVFAGGIRCLAQVHQIYLDSLHCSCATTFSIAHMTWMHPERHAWVFLGLAEQGTAVCVACSVLECRSYKL